MISSRTATRLIGPISILLLAGCGRGSTAPPPQVASVRSSTSPASAVTTSADPEAGRPQLRVDTSQDERRRLTNVWSSCLKTQGVATYTKGGWVFPAKGEDDLPAAFKACHRKQPRQPASQDPARNPHYEQDNRDWIRCINKKSPVIKIRETPDGWTYVKDYDPNDADDDAFNRIVTDCESEAFGPG
jgi:hypothetical protein